MTYVLNKHIMVLVDRVNLTNYMEVMSMKKLTWNDIDGKIPDCTIGIWMDICNDEMGFFPSWNDIIPEWVHQLFNGGK